MLEQLIRDGHVRVHLPWIVVEELVSGLSAEYRRQINAALEALRGIRRDFLDVGSMNAMNTLRALSERIEANWRSDVSEWITRNNVSVHSVPAEAAEAAITRYFSGMAPFRAPKNRNDFPDALIWETVASLASRFGRIEFVSGDTGFTEAAAALSKIRRHSSLAEFMSIAVDELNASLFERLLERSLDNGYVEGSIEAELEWLLVGADVAVAGFDDSTAKIEEVEAIDDIDVRAGDQRRTDTHRASIPFAADVRVVTFETRPSTGNDDPPKEWEDDDIPIGHDGAEWYRARSIRCTVEGALDIEFIPPALTSYVDNKACERIVEDAPFEVKGWRVVRAELD